jgi:hypothetical protein
LSVREPGPQRCAESGNEDLGGEAVGDGYR